MFKSVCLLMLAIAWVLVSSAAAPEQEARVKLSDLQAEDATFQKIRGLLESGGRYLEYDALMEISATISGAGHPIAHLHHLLHAMIHKRNRHPRVDQMILIFSARAIGDSPYFITDAGGLLASILDQRQRLNEWVISFVAYAIGRYPYVLPQGDQLVDRMDAEVENLRRIPAESAELFGFHFLPPPRHALVRSYLSGIEDKKVREQERHRYYLMILQNISDDDIGSSIGYLQSQQRIGTPGCPRVMQCLLKNKNQIPLQ